MKNTPEDIKQLESKIIQLKSQEGMIQQNKTESDFVRASKIGFRVGIEMFSAVIVGAAIGYLLDNVIETKPWLLVVFMFLGGAAGILNVYRLAQNEENKRKE